MVGSEGKLYLRNGVIDENLLEVGYSELKLFGCDISGEVWCKISCYIWISVLSYHAISLEKLKFVFKYLAYHTTYVDAINISLLSQIPVVKNQPSDLTECTEYMGWIYSGLIQIWIFLSEYVSSKDVSAFCNVGEAVKKKCRI